MDNFDPYDVFLDIATNIPVLLKTGFVLQVHICWFDTQEIVPITIYDKNLFSCVIFLWKS